MKYFDHNNNCIIFKNQKATAFFWDEHWNTYDFKKSVLSGKNDRFISKFTKKFIPPSKSKKILEGGCGQGNLVYSLQLSGYDTYGVDYARRTIAEIKKAMPGLKVSVGNVENLDFPNNFFDGYWSLGVIEHFFDGYDKMAEEMKRVIKPSGYLFLTFPYLSPLRKIKARFGKYPKFDLNNFEEDRFYQFALDYEKTTIAIENLGFELVYKKPFDGIKGLKDEISFLEKPLQRIYNSSNIPLKIATALISRLFAPISSHSILLIFKKND